MVREDSSSKNYKQKTDNYFTNSYAGINKCMRLPRRVKTRLAMTKTVLSPNTIKSLSSRKLLNNSLSPRRERVRVRGR